jgi:hypothetical protein
MTKIAQKTTGDLTGYIFWDEPDQLLRNLSALYIASCFQKLSAHLGSLVADPAHLRFGWLHPGVADVPTGRENPLAFLGWLWAERRPPISEEREAALAEPLLAQTPRLRWAASFRSGIFLCDARDPEHILKAMREYVSDDPSAGHPDWLARGASNAPLIADIVEACVRRERSAVLHALDQAAAIYSTDGADLLRAAVLQWMDSPSGLSKS